MAVVVDAAGLALAARQGTGLNNLDDGAQPDLGAQQACDPVRQAGGIGCLHLHADLLGACALPVDIDAILAGRTFDPGDDVLDLGRKEQHPPWP